MFYQIKFMFTDGKDIRVGIHQHRLDSFLKAINECRIYWMDDELNGGFWLPVDKIRYMRIKRVEDDEREEGKRDILKEANLA